MLIKSLLLFIFAAASLTSNIDASVRKKKKVNEKNFKKISLYFEYLEKGRNKPRISRSAVKLIKNLGPHFKDELELVRLQIKINSKPFNFNNCKSYNLSEKSSAYNYHLLQVLRFCHKKLVKTKKEEDLTPDEVTFIKDFYVSLIETENLGLIRLKSKRTVFPKSLAGVLSSKKFDIDEITALFQRTYAAKHINYGKELTSHLQSIGLFPSKESRLFKKEFRSLCATFLKHKDKQHKIQVLEQILSFYSENRSLIGHKYSNKKFRQMSRHLSRKGFNNEAKKFVSRAIETQSKEHRPPLYFERIYLDIINEDYKSALKYINRSGLLGLELFYDSKLRYWIGRVFLENKEVSLAEFLFKSQITKQPLNYYSVLSSAHLQKLGHHKFLERNYLYNKKNGISLLEDPSIKKTDAKLSRLKVWLKIESEKLASLEIKEIMSKKNNVGRDIASQNKKLNSSFQILKLFQQEDDYLSSFKFFYRNRFFRDLDFMPTTTRILFPTPYLKKIKANSKDLDPVLMLSLIRQESAFNPRAISSAGARGLMQLMPNTARMYRKRLKKSELYKPNLNLYIGSKYLRYLYKKYDSSLIYTLSSYNAGETNLRRWRKKYFNVSNDLLKVESIPFEETENYVKYITRNMFFYKIIFGKPLLSGLDWVKSSI